MERVRGDFRLSAPWIYGKESSPLKKDAGVLKGIGGCLEVGPLHHRNRLMVDGAVLGLFLVFSGCSPDYKAGDCIQNPQDGYIWRITAVEFGKYTAQGWVDGKWGLNVPMDSDVPKGRYVKVQCPFSTGVVQERR
jgi:hypothetical protein